MGRVLIVDENAYIRQSLEQGLISLGCENIETAENVDEARAIIKALRPRVVVVDDQLDHRSGVAFCQWLRRNEESPNPYISIVLLVESPSMSDLEAARAVGVNEVVSKPCTPPGLLRRIENVFTRPRAFVQTRNYFGPDRRRPRAEDYEGPERRTAQA